MRRDDVEEFLSLLDAGAASFSDEWVNCSCPLASYTHFRGTDTKPSFGISISGERRSVYKCFTCTPEPKSLFHLIHRIWLLTGEYPFGLAEFLIKHEIIDKPRVIDENREWEIRITPATIPEDVVNEYPLLDEEPNEVTMFIECRNISLSACAKLGVRNFPSKDWVVFPFTDVDGNIKMMSRRAVRFKAYRHITVDGFECVNTGSWFGLHLVDWKKPVLIVESELSLLRLMTLGVSNVIAAGGAKANTAQIKSLHGHRLIIGFDADDAGHRATRAFLTKTEGMFDVVLADWSIVSANDPGDLRNVDEYKEVLNNLKTSVSDLGFYV